MRYMMMVKAGSNYETGAPPDARAHCRHRQACRGHDKSGRTARNGRAAAELARARVRAAVGVTDGPFVESKELIGGYAILQASSKEEAIELGKTRFS